MMLCMASERPALEADSRLRRGLLFPAPSPGGSTSLLSGTPLTEPRIARQEHANLFSRPYVEAQTTQSRSLALL